MEQAVNLFSKGLQIDTNPMVQGDDTLSDALNATFVTMNGNEVILLNDMGNRRVDHAFLPAGYEPVGMKEYGGIIYVASYNPITNRSLIGSFPSPERRISEIDDDSLGIGSYYSFGERFFGTNNIDSESATGINFLKNDSFMDSLTSDTSLHAGDKFSIYSDYIWNHESDISNFNLYDAGTKKVDPKNKLFTLAVGVMNSLNEFVDITSSLERFKKENNKAVIITDYDSDSEKFNKGYFIAPTGPETNQEEDILPKEREKLAVNTYAYKLVGPLQLKTTLNHILNFDFTLAWETTPNPNIYKLIVTGIAVYNCPDKLDSNENSSRIDTNGESVTVTTTRALYAKSLLNDINYKIYRDDSEKGLDSFDLFLKNGSNWEISLVKADYPKLQTTYDINTNTFTSTCTKIYNILVSQLVEERFEDKSRSEVSLENTIIDYYICVKATVDNYTETIGNTSHSYPLTYLKNLSYQGSVDVSKIGSNIVELNGYRYYYDKTSDGTYITMTFQIDAFPNNFTKFTNFKVAYGELKLVELEWKWNYDYNNNTLYQSDTVPSGRITFTFKELLEDENGIKPKNLYELEFSYKKESTIEDNSGVLPTKIHRFLLTTPLFNPCYSGSNKDYTEDYGLFMGDIETRLETGRVDIAYNNNEIILKDISESEQKRREKYLNIGLELNGEINDSLNKFTSTASGSFIYILPTSPSPEENIESTIEYNNSYNLNYSTLKVVISENNNYPSTLQLSNEDDWTTNRDSISIEITSVPTDQTIEKMGAISNIIIREDSSDTKYLIGNIESKLLSNKILTFNHKYYDYFISKADGDRELEYGTIYVNVTNPIMETRLFPDLYFGFLVVSHGLSTHNWWTYINKNSFVLTVRDHERNLDSSSLFNGDRRYTDFNDAEDSEYRMGTALLKLIQEASNAKVSFLYMFVDVEHKELDLSASWHNYPAAAEYYTTTPYSDTYYYTLEQYTMVFWRDWRADKLYILRPSGNNPDLNIDYFRYRSGKHASTTDTNSINNTDTLVSEFKSNILKHIGMSGPEDPNDPNENHYIVAVDNYSPSNIKYPGLDYYIYNKLYSFVIKVSGKALFNGTITQYSQKELKLLNFVISDNQVELKSINYVKNSSSEFLESILNVLQNNYISDIYIETGNKIPTPNPGNIYKYSLGKIILVEDPPFVYSMEDRTLLFRKAYTSLRNSPTYLVCGSNNLRGSDGGDPCGKTIISFNLFVTIPKGALYHE